MTTRWGRIGTAGQSKTKTFADAADAARQVAKLVEEKTGEGYVEKTA
jgi:predicted DNA-binding WGR domain protein